MSDTIKDHPKITDAVRSARGDIFRAEVTYEGKTWAIEAPSSIGEGRFCDYAAMELIKTIGQTYLPDALQSTQTNLDALAMRLWRSMEL